MSGRSEFPVSFDQQEGFDGYPRYRKYRRKNGIYYCEDLETGKQQSLGTRNVEVADRLVAARNETTKSQLLNKELARIYAQGADPRMTTRTWADV